LSKRQYAGSSNEQQGIRQSATTQEGGGHGELGDEGQRGIVQLAGIPHAILLVLLEQGYILET
jgi:hypothetical protein